MTDTPTRLADVRARLSEWHDDNCKTDLACALETIETLAQSVADWKSGAETLQDAVITLTRERNEARTLVAEYGAKECKAVLQVAKAEADRDALAAALSSLTTSAGPHPRRPRCWCPHPFEEPHKDYCLQARAALARVETK